MSDPAQTTMQANTQLNSVLPTEPGIVPSTLQFPIVGIGASAGGLQALQRLFENMPS